VIAALKSAFPGVRIGFLGSSWAIRIVEQHSLVSRTHIFDHFFLNRRPLPRREKLRSHIRTGKQALKEIREASYDVAIELLPRMHNTVPMFWQAGIPIRIGYRSGGFGHLLTHSLEWEDVNQHASAYHMDLLRFLPIGEEHLSNTCAVLPSSDADRLSSVGIDTSRLAVFHPQAGVAFKQWRADKWRELARICSADGYQVAFTGSGADQEAEVSSIIDGIDGCINLCNRLNWDEFISTIEHARFVVCVDTVAQHVASAFNTPCVAIIPGPNPHIYRPAHERHKVLLEQVDCVPCFRPYGCEGMECIRNVETSRVYDAIRELLA
jgi:ADP-heptose:LPS heptosyltransferase